MKSLLTDEPIGVIRLNDLLNILNALALTDCDQRTLSIVARSTGLGEWYSLESVQPVIFIEQRKQLEGGHND